jgi:peptide/nickel transport system substrate-binding protein
MTTTEPAPLFPLIVTAPMIVSRKNGEGATTADYNSGRAIIGTGPYKLVSAVLGDRVIFKRNDSWWGGKAAYENVVYRMIPNVPMAASCPGS